MSAHLTCKRCGVADSTVAIYGEGIVHRTPRSCVANLRGQVLALTAERDALKPDADMGLGYCPVQIEGEAGGLQYYFRARGERWSLNVSEEGDTCEFAAVAGRTILSGRIEARFAAGWMPHSLAKALVDWALSVEGILDGPETDAMKARENAGCGKTPEQVRGNAT